MKKTILLYGIGLALLTAFLKFIEYRVLVRELSNEFYVGTVALFFTILGIWMGRKLTNKKAAPPISEPPVMPAPPPDMEAQLHQLGISKRELEVLSLMAKGHSNQEIADQLFLSLNTVKTHSSNLFQKLDVKRRTQAVQKAKEVGILGN